MLSKDDRCLRVVLGTDGEFRYEPVTYVEYRETWNNLRIATVRSQSGREYGCFEYHLVKD